MCVGIKVTYPECGHFKIDFTTKCEAGFNYPEWRCNVWRVFCARESISSSPSLCIHCYRRKVDDIIACYQQKIKIVDEELEKLTLMARAMTSDADRDKVKKDRSALEVARGEYIDQRIADLEEFRVQQGVWGDG